MKIEDAIKQRKFASEHQKAHLNVLFTAAMLNQRTTSLLKPYQLTWQQFNILRILRGQHPQPATVKLLTERMIDKMSNASRLVDKLLEKELVQRNPSSEDRRRVDIHITEAGLALLEKASSELEEGTSFGYHRLSEAEAVQLNELLDKLRSEEQDG